MKFDVFLTNDAEDDLYELYNYILENDSKNHADHVFNKIKESCLSLVSFPDRGHIPPELKRISVYNYKEIHFKPYRIIYQVIEQKVYIQCIFDGRRDIQDVLEGRLFR